MEMEHIKFEQFAHAQGLYPLNMSSGSRVLSKVFMFMRSVSGTLLNFCTHQACAHPLCPAVPTTLVVGVGTTRTQRPSSLIMSRFSETSYICSISGTVGSAQATALVLTLPDEPYWKRRRRRILLSNTLLHPRRQSASSAVKKAERFTGSGWRYN